MRRNLAWPTQVSEEEGSPLNKGHLPAGQPEKGSRNCPREPGS